MDGILIKNAEWVVTMDPERRLIRDGAVAIRDEDSGAAVQGEVIDGAGKLVLPGLIDTIVQQLGRGLAICPSIRAIRLSRRRFKAEEASLGRSPPRVLLAIRFMEKGVSR